ncbi:hypothetical protein [Acinetobacter modestus]|uniref:TIGR02646 family protein n=1 Tax=Acinetobacter modestus TaxID=1776740 RepID=A0ABP2TX03_9GAMM|nr:hypothetical protein [Acinetobacter modestus]ENU26828.1 TIGR02646 family protein [Acinetobacter modestus]GGA11729.1 hypothetical protein GCM10017554_04530 [Acinetobacter modestus]
MQQINKGSEPTELTEYKRKNPTHRYDDLGDDPEQIRLAIRQACLAEQAYLCAYCCRQVGVKDHDCMNEHILPRQGYPQFSFAFNNIVASCTTKGCCDDAKENQEIAISPLSPRCKTEFNFNLSGTVTGLTDDAKQTIDVLRLGDSLQQNQKLVDMRKQAIANFLFTQSINIDDLIEDDELLTLLIDDLHQVSDGKLQPFAPVISKALQNWVDGNK